MSTSHPILKLDCMANANAALRLRLLAAAQAAEAAYDARMQWGEYAERAGAINSDSIECSDGLSGIDTRVCWAETPTHIYISYRGTPADSIPAWLRNLEAVRTLFEPLKCGQPHRVHAGFVAEYLATRKQLRATIAQLRHTQHKPVIIVGHSKGGALAQLASLDLGMWHPTLCTFGAPRVFGHSLARLADMLSPNHFRVRHSNDIVPLVPGAGLLNHLRYRHSGELIMLTESGDIVRRPDWFARLKEAVLGYRLDGVRDHFIGSYIEALASHGID